MTHHEAVQYERCLVFWARILRQAFDDLIALSNGYTVITDNGRRMPAAEREATLREVQEWFFVDSDAPASLAATCDHLDLSVGWIRGRADRSSMAHKQYSCGGTASLPRSALSASICWQQAPTLETAVKPYRWFKAL